MGHRTRQRGAHTLQGQHARRVQPQGVAAQFVRGQRHQPLLLDQARPEPHRRQRHRERGQRYGRAEREEGVRRRQQDQERYSEPGAPRGWDQAAHRHVADQHAQRRAGEEGAGGLGGVGDVERFAAHDQAVGEPQGEVDRAAGAGGPEEGVGAPGGGDRRAAGGAGRAGGEAEADSGRGQGVEQGGEEEAGARGEEGEQGAARRVAGDLGDAAHHVEDRTARQIAVLGEDLVQQAPADSPAEGGDQALGQEDDEDRPDRQAGGREEGRGRREGQGEVRQGRPRGQAVGAGEEQGRAQYLGQGRAEHAHRRQQRGVGGPVHQGAEREAGRRLSGDVGRGGEEEGGELGGAEEGSVAVGGHGAESVVAPAGAVNVSHGCERWGHGVVAGQRGHARTQPVRALAARGDLREPEAAARGCGCASRGAGLAAGASARLPGAAGRGSGDRAAGTGRARAGLDRGLPHAHAA